VHCASVGEKPHDAGEDFLEVERGADRRDDLVEEALLDFVRPLPGGDPRILAGRAGLLALLRLRRRLLAP
jgi:hypothetical protein